MFGHSDLLVLLLVVMLEAQEKKYQLSNRSARGLSRLDLSIGNMGLCLIMVRARSSGQTDHPSELAEPY